MSEVVEFKTLEGECIAIMAERLPQLLKRQRAPVRMLTIVRFWALVFVNVRTRVRARVSDEQETCFGAGWAHHRER